MADIKQCDSCGVISSRMGSRVAIQVLGTRLESRYQTIHARTGEIVNDDKILDFCDDCTAKVLEPKRLPITANPDDL